MDGRLVEAAFYNESLQEQDAEEMRFGNLDGILDEDDMAPLDRRLPTRINDDELGRQEDQEEAPLRAGEEMAMEHDRRRKWLSIPRPTRIALRRLT